MKGLRTALLVVAVVAVGGFGLLAYFSARDDSEVATSTTQAGEQITTECPEGSGLPARDGRSLDDEQERALLARGNVVLAGPPEQLASVQEELTGGYDPEFAAAGQAVYVEPTGDGVTALAWERRLEAEGPDDPALTAFVDEHLGHGAGDDCG